jgi:hypothetical protein
MTSLPWQGSFGDVRARCCQIQSASASTAAVVSRPAAALAASAFPTKLARTDAEAAAAHDRDAETTSETPKPPRRRGVVAFSVARRG